MVLVSIVFSARMIMFVCVVPLACIVLCSPESVLKKRATLEKIKVQRNERLAKTKVVRGRRLGG